MSDDADTTMGPLECAVYRQEFKAGLGYRRELERRAEREALRRRQRSGFRGFAALRPEIAGEEHVETREVASSTAAPTPGRVAARLLLARAFDASAGLKKEILNGTPLVIVEVSDTELLVRIAQNWKSLPLLRGLKITSLAKVSHATRPGDQDVVAHVVTEKPRSAASAEDRGQAFRAIQLAVPIVVICPVAHGHVPEPLIDAATHRVVVPPVDAGAFARVVGCVTGRRCRLSPLPTKSVALERLLLAVRFDRTPAQCFDELSRLAAVKSAGRGSRDLTLDEVHGADAAVGWASDLVRDVDAWRQGRIGWEAIDRGAVFHGPPGTAKTTLAKVIAKEAKLHLVSTSFAQMQSAGEGHLGHLLREMRRAFEEARANQPSMIFIDEIDSFPDRNSLRHDHRDYVTSYVNALLELCDGLVSEDAAGRSCAVVLLGACNNVTRVDPALLRPGRMNRVIDIGLPKPDEIVRIFRLRLCGELENDDLTGLGYLALGSTGADIGRAVHDARRRARNAGRAMTMTDLSLSLAPPDDRSPAQRRRAAVHEASHILVDVALFGADEIHANISKANGRDGMTVRTGIVRTQGTYRDHHRRLQVLLAGRAGESVLTGCPSDGAGSAPGSDLQRAGRLASAMAGSLGLTGGMPLVYLGRHDDTEALLTHPHILTAVDFELRKAEAAAMDIIERHRGVVEWIARMLLRNGSIDGHAVANAMKRFAKGRLHGLDGDAISSEARRPRRFT